MQHKQGSDLKRGRFSGSLTVEAAIVLPLYLIGMMTMISLIYMLKFYLVTAQAVVDVGQELAVSCVDGHNIAISEVEEQIISKINQNDTSYAFIKNGENGLLFDKSRLNDTEYLEIVVDYVFIPLGINMFGLAELPICQRSLVHIWNGYGRGYLEYDEGEYVYITADSLVYHKNRECTYLRLSVRQVIAEEIESLRNKSGAKYYSCEICHSNLSDGILYVTSDGNRYHNRVSCGGLKRTVRAVRLQDIPERRPCSRCGN